MHKFVLSTLVAALAFGTLGMRADAADLGPELGAGSRHIGSTLYGWNWRDRCAWAGYYCLYAWDGYVYRYPWDDRPSALAYHSRRHRHFRYR